MPRMVLPRNAGEAHPRYYRTSPTLSVASELHVFHSHQTKDPEKRSISKHHTNKFKEIFDTALFSQISFKQW